MIAKYLPIFISSVTVSLLLTWCIRNLAVRFEWALDRPGKRRIHKAPVPRIGGVAIYLTFMGLLLALSGTHATSHDLTRLISRIAVPTTVVFLLGLYDDVRSANPLMKVGVQGLAAVLLYVNGVRLTKIDLLFRGDVLGPVISVAATIFWVLLVTNAFNLIDGLDGLSAGSALLATMAMFVVALFRGNEGLALVTVVIGGAILGFLRFNFNPATIFLGDCGSLTIGFLLSAVALAWAEKSSTAIAVAAPLLVFGLPILDVTLAVVRRLLRGAPLFEADADHIHHKLLKRGFSHRSVSVILCGVSGAFAILSLVLLRFKTAHSGVIVLVFVAAATFSLWQLNYLEFTELQRVMRRVLNEKRIIANNLKIRRAGEILSECYNEQDVVNALGLCFKGSGFDGVQLDTEMAGHPKWWVTRREGFEEADSQWTLRMNLTTASGVHCGVLTFLKTCRATPFLLDDNVLLSSNFDTVLADALFRVMKRTGDGQSEPPNESELATAESLTTCVRPAGAD